MNALTDVLTEAWRGLARHPLRSALSALGVTIALAAIVAVLAGEVSWQEALRREYEKLGANTISVMPPTADDKVRRRRLQFDDVDAIRRECPAVDLVDAFLLAVPVDVKVGRDHATLNGYQVGPDILKIRGWATTKNPNLKQTSPDGCWLSPFAAKRLLGEGYRQQLPASVRIAGRVTPLNGLVAVPPALDDKGEGYLLLPLGGNRKHVADKVVLIQARAKDLERAATQIDEVMSRRLGARRLLRIATGPWRMAAEQISARARFRLFTGVTLACILCVALLGVASTLLSSLEERTREIALRRALGAQARRVMAEVLSESALMCLVGGALGCLLASVALRTLGPQLLRGMELPATGHYGDAVVVSRLALHLPRQALVAGWLSALLGSLAAASVPALAAAGLQPAAALSAAPRDSHLVHRSLAVAQVLVGVCAAAVLLALYAGMTQDALATMRHLSWRDTILFDGFTPRPEPSNRVIMAESPQTSQRLNEGFRELWRSPAEIEALKRKSSRLGSLHRCWGTSSFPQVKHGREAVGPAVVAVDEGLGNEFRGDEARLVQGRAISLADSASSERVCVLSDGLTKRLFGGEDALGQQVRLSGVPFTVVGITHRPIYELRFFFQTGQEDTRPSAPEYEMVLPIGAIPESWVGNPRFILILKEPQRAKEAEAEFEAIVRDVARLEPGYNPQIFNMAGWESDFEQRARQMTIRAALMGSVGFWVALVGLVNMLLVSAYARVREIGLLRALGATRASIALSSISEGLIISLIGAVLGLGLAGLLASAIARVVRLPVAIPPAWAAIVVTCTVLASCLAALLPAAQAASIEPSVALRHE